MDYRGNWPDQNFSDPSFQDDVGSLRPSRRLSASPPAADRSSLPSGVPRAPRRFAGAQRPLSAGPGLGSRQPLCGPAGEGAWRGKSPEAGGGGSGLRISPRQRRAESLAMALALAARERDGDEEALSSPPSLSFMPPPSPHSLPPPQSPQPPSPRRQGSAPASLTTALRGRAASSSFLRSAKPSATDVTAAAKQLDGSSSPLSSVRRNRPLPLEDPFLLASRAPQLRQSPRNVCTDLAVASTNRKSTIPSVRRSTSDGVNANLNPCVSSKHEWPKMCLNNSPKYAQSTEDPLNDAQWNVYDDFLAESKNSPKEKHPQNITSWQYRTEIEPQSPFLHPVSHSNLSGSISLNRTELLVKQPQDYETLIRNMEEVEEREINACLKDEFYNPSDMGDWSKDSAHAPLDNVLLENFEELEQLIQEEDDDVQMALHIEDQQFPFQKGKEKASDYLELHKPIYQGNTDYDESDDDLSPEVAAAMMHSEERGILMGSAPSRVFNALFSDREKEPLAVFSACPLHPENVVVPTADGEIPYSPSAEDLTALASVSLGEEPPNGSVFSDTLRRRGSYDAVMTEASKAYTDEQDSDPDRLSFTTLSLGVGGNLECVLDTACPPTHFSKVQLRGSTRPDWFPGYYKALPHIKGITAVCSDPGIVLEDAWWTLQTTIA